MVFSMGPMGVSSVPFQVPAMSAAKTATASAKAAVKTKVKRILFLLTGISILNFRLLSSIRPATQGGSPAGCLVVHQFPRENYDEGTPLRVVPAHEKVTE